MKFSKHQKEIIKYICSGKIYNLVSYLKSFNLGETVKLDKGDIINKFNNDAIPKNYYYPQNLPPKCSYTYPESIYNSKVANKELNPQNYKSATLQLDFSQGIKHEHWNNYEYTINFYDGVYISKSFDNIIDFLALWEYLNSEMLILEVPNNFTPDVLSLFYRKENDSHQNSVSLPLDERIKQINYNDFTYADSHYISDIYSLSYEECTICKDYLDRRIYPTTKLKIFIQKRFKTTEEKTQGSALWAAWIAIFVSIFLTFLPHFQKPDEDNIKNISQDIKDIKTIIQNEVFDNTFNPNLSELIKQLNLIIEKESTPISETIAPESDKKESLKKQP